MSQKFKQGMDSLIMKWFCENSIYKCKRIKLDPYLTPDTKTMQNRLKKNKTWNYKTPSRKHKGLVLQHWSRPQFLWFDNKSTGNKRQINKWNYVKLQSSYTEKKKVIYGLLEKFCKPYIWERSKYPKYIRNSDNSIVKAKHFFTRGPDRYLSNEDI